MARAKEVVQGLQRRIYRAAREGNRKKMKSLQNLLLRSGSAIYCAVEQVTCVNSGKTTPGVDGLVYLTSDARAQLVQEIKQINLREYKPKPVKRVYIPKGEGRLRPLGLPVVKDRAVQWIATAALEPEWEARFECNSYGYRPGRSAHDAITTIKRALDARKKQYVLEGDIEACFDNISHEFLLRSIKMPLIRRLVRGWLTAGIVDKGKFWKPTKGTPQGGVISPLLANIALHGMDQLLGAETLAGEYLEPSQRKGKWQGVVLVRFADDFVVIADDVATLEEDVKPVLAPFLAVRGLSLNWAKTRVVPAWGGFDFLGFNIRCRWWQFRAQSEQPAEPPRPCVVVTPAKGRVKRHMDRLRRLVKGNKTARQIDLIKLLNPVVRGWATYYRHCTSASVFSALDHQVHKLIWQWARRRHPNRGKQWVKDRYFGMQGHRWAFWNFGDDHEITRLQKHGDVRYARYSRLPLGTFSPYAGASAVKWWLKRAMGDL